MKKLYQFSMTGGAVSGETKRRGRPATKAALLPNAEPPSTTSTLVMDTEVTRTPPHNLSSTISVKPTISPSLSNTVWETSLIGYAESGSKTITTDEWSLLPSRFREQLYELATARGEAPDDLVFTVAEFYTESESEQSEWSVIDALRHFLENEII